MNNGKQPAFPRIDGIEQGDYGRQDFHVSGGLTKREYFAGLALQALLQVYEEDCPRTAVEMADALLAALNEPREP